MLSDQLADTVGHADEDDSRRHDPVGERFDRVGEEHTPLLVLKAVELVDEDGDGTLAARVSECALDRVRRHRSRAQ